MSTFKDFLLFEDSRTRRAKRGWIIGHIRQHCPNYAKSVLDQLLAGGSNSPGIYRGLGEQEREFLVGDPSEGQPRRSRNTSNEYTLLIDNLDAWSSFPKRSRSFVCSTSEYFAEGFGITYLVFPPDNTSIGVVPTSDIWDGFLFLDTQLGVEIEDLNRVLRELQEVVDIKPNDTNWNQLKKNLTTIDKIISERGLDDFEAARNNHYVDRLLNFMKRKDIGITQTLTDLLNPQLNGFKLSDPATVSTIQKPHEIWFSAPAAFVNTHEVDIKELLSEALK